MSFDNLVLQRGKTTGSGGAVFGESGTHLFFTNCTLISNDAAGVSSGGGAVCGADVTLENCTLTGNTTHKFGGGGVAVLSTAALTNCTLIGNIASGDGIDGGGGVIANIATLINCTLTGNTARNNGGGGSGGGVNAINLTIQGCIVAGNTAGNSYANNIAYITCIPIGYNLADGGVSPVLTQNTGDNFNAILGNIFDSVSPAPADNGGSVQTIKILHGGLADNKIPSGLSWLPATDARGIPRPYSGAYASIGAYECTVTLPFPDPDPADPVLSHETLPIRVWVILSDDTRLEAPRQPNGIYIATVPHGTDISLLSADATLPRGATSRPALPVSHDFTQGPFVFTVTAENGVTTGRYTLEVKIEKPAGPTERLIVSFTVADWEISVMEQSDGTVSVRIRIPFAANVDPATLNTIRAIFDNLGLTNVSYVCVDAQGREMPLKVYRAAVRAPYLEIRGTATGMDDLADGVLTRIRYTLANDATDYVQTFPNGGLKLSDMPGYPKPPAPDPDPKRNNSGGCDATGPGFAVLVLVTLLKRK